MILSGGVDLLQGSALYPRSLSIPFPLNSMSIKGRESMGNIVTKQSVDRIVRA